MNKIARKFQAYFLKKDIQRRLNNNSKKIVMFDIPEHGNIGDQCIAIAQKKFIDTHFSEFDYVEIPARLSEKMIPTVLQSIDSQSKIALHGGGNFGDLYPSHDQVRHSVINNFRENTIVQFPQSAYFSKEYITDGKLDVSKEYYSNNLNFKMFAREQKTLKILKEYFPHNETYLIPDIVFSMEKIVPNEHRMGVVTLFRKDFESSLNSKFKEDVLDLLVNNFEIVEESDTHLGEGILINLENRDDIVKSKLNEISSYELVITDRLHGMIFAYLTNTPCIVFDNNNHKISQTYYTWLQECKSIQLVENLDIRDLRIMIKEIIGSDSEEFHLKNKFAPLINLINE